MVASIILVLLAYFHATRIEAPKRVENLSAFLQGTLRNPLWNIDPRAAQAILQSSRIDPAIVSVDLYDDQSIKIAEFKRDTPPSNFAITQSSQIMAPRGQTAIIGRLVIVYDTATYVEQSYVVAVLLVLLVISLASASGLTLRRLLDKHVADPVSKISQRAAAIGSGSLSEPVPLLGDVLEIQELSKALEATRLRISGLVQGLESQVKNRTAELESALDGLHKVQDSLVESQKLAALGGLVAGVAHDLNTPIGNARMAVSTASHYAQILRSALEPSNKSKRSDIERLCLLVEESCKLAETNAIRSAELVSSFMRLAVDRASERRRNFDLKEMMLETLAASMPSLRPAGIEIIDVALKPQIDMDSYPGTLAQILGNLWDNARTHGFSNACPGHIAIGCQRDPHDVHSAIIWVADDGDGIDPQNLKRVMEPFFTTKFGRGGNGLGLANVSNLVVKILGGAVSVSSPIPENMAKILFNQSISKGTLIEIRIPCSAPDAIAEPPKSPSS